MFSRLHIQPLWLSTGRDVESVQHLKNTSQHFHNTPDPLAGPLSLIHLQYTTLWISGQLYIFVMMTMLWIKNIQLDNFSDTAKNQARAKPHNNILYISGPTATCIILQHSCPDSNSPEDRPLIHTAQCLPSILYQLGLESTELYTERYIKLAGSSY